MSLLLDLSRFRGGTQPIERREEPGAFGPDSEDFRIAAPVAFAGELRKDTQQVRLAGRVQTTLEAPCSRCLEPYAIPVDAEFDWLFVPVTQDIGSGEHEASDEDASVSFYEHDTIDLGAVIREQCYLALPMKPLCRETCAGLCPVCGVNRNTETCSCQETWVDPRLDGLKALKKDR